MSFEAFSKHWKRDDTCSSCLYSLITEKCVGYQRKRPHHLTSYWYVKDRTKSIAAHKILWVLDTKMSVPEGFEIDHIDRNGTNNLRTNLRLLTSLEQKFNASSRSNSSSLYKGVSWMKQKHKWRAQVQLDKNKVHLGYFDNEIDAALAYDHYVKEHCPPCSYLNFV